MYPISRAFLTSLAFGWGCYLFLTLLEFELRALHLLSRYSTALATTSAQLAILFQTSVSPILGSILGMESVSNLSWLHPFPHHGHPFNNTIIY
jgi:hypothetical protein